MKILSLCSTISLLMAGQLAPVMADPVQSDTLVAQGHMAAQAWRDACTDKASDQSCVIVQTRANKQSCRKSLELLMPGQRRARPANKAQIALVAALDGLAREPQSEAVQAMVAEGRYLVAEAAFLQFLRVKAPVGLNFDARNAKRYQRSQETFLDFLERARTKAQEAHKAYTEVTELIKPLGDLDDPATARYTIREKMPAFKRCYEEAKRTQSDLVGTLNLKLRIDADGKVVHAGATGMVGHDLQSCVTKAAKGLLFPSAHSSDATLIDFPLRFGVAAPFMRLLRSGWPAILRHGREVRYA